MSRSSSRRVSPSVGLGILIAVVAVLLWRWYSAPPEASPADEPSVAASSAPESSAAPAPLPTGSGLEVHFIDVGNADAIFIACDGQYMLIDAGLKDTGDRVVGYLMERDIPQLDLVVSTHPDADHIGGMAQVLRTFPVDTFVMSTMEDEFVPTTRAYENTIEALIRYDVPVAEAVAGDTYRIGGATVTILGPLRTYEDTNTQSVVCRLQYGKVRFLFTGDCTKQAEADMIAAGVDLDADFLKVAHHGSKSSSSQAFLNAVSPDYCMITCADDNDYGHPHEQVMRRLVALNIPIYRIDFHGTVVAASDGKTISVTTEKEAP